MWRTWYTPANTIAEFTIWLSKMDDRPDSVITGDHWWAHHWRFITIWLIGRSPKMFVQTTLVAHQVVELLLASQLFLLLVERCLLLFELLLIWTVRDRVRDSLFRDWAQIGRCCFGNGFEMVWESDFGMILEGFRNGLQRHNLGRGTIWNWKGKIEVIEKAIEEIERTEIEKR